MKVKKLTLKSLPSGLRNIPSPPKALYTAGAPLSDLLERPRVAIVGSRKVSPYGKAVTTELAGKLAERGIVVVSGLALGVDSLAHQAALEAGGLTIAVLPRGLDHIYPASHHNLANKIVEQGGALITEYPDGTEIFRSNFIARNRLIAGLAEAIVITEAAERSGSLHTARFALEQGKSVLAVPGNITSPTSAGTNNLLKAGASPVTSYLDILHALGLEDSAPAANVTSNNEQEQAILDLIKGGEQDGEELLRRSGLAVESFNQALTMLELAGCIRAVGANHWALA